MPTNVDIPSFGESVREAILIKWHKSDGDAITKDEPLCELETDKANVDVPAPAAGVLRRVTAEGATVQIGETIGRIDEAGAGNGSAAPKAASPAPAAKAAEVKAPEPKAEVDLSPAVRKMVEENKLNASDIAASGPGGRITKEDVQKHLEAKSAPAPAAEKTPTLSPTPVAEKPASKSETVPTPSKAPASTALTFEADGTRRTPMSKMRINIARRLVEAQHTAAILHTFNEIDLSEVMALRTKYKETFEKTHGVGLGFMSFFARATVLALKEFARINASIDGNDIIYHEYVNLGIAVSTDRGLTVPVLRNVEKMGFAKIESEIKRLAGAARDGKLGIPELSGATFTITNGGVFGSLLSTPILTPPQSGILGMHAIVKRPIAVGPKLDQIEIRPMMNVALGYDHRLVDGRESVSFLVRLKQLLEDPARLMLEV